ncbi:MAG: hypothetical protein JST67_07870 [Bacteroidetes bacterium]|nr:hypothetical protein [Bacteroidota bacterium]
MRKKTIKLVCILSSFYFVFNAKAQDTLCVNKKYVPHNNISLELGGAGLVYSLNYERIFFVKKYLYHSAKLGLGFPPIGGFNRVLMPLDYTLYIGKSRVKLIAGVGIVGVIGTNPFPSGASNQNDYLKLYNQDSYAAISKYGTNTFEKSFDLAYTGKIGLKYIVNKHMDVYVSVNCFYSRFNTHYTFNPIWPCSGISFKFGIIDKRK